MNSESPVHSYSPTPTLVLWGASGHGKVVLDVATRIKAYKVIFFVDDRESDDHVREHCRHKVLPAAQFLRRLTTEPLDFVVSIGQNDSRAKCFHVGVERGLSPATLADPSAVISSSASLGRGTVVMPAVVVNASAEIGMNCILNTASVVEHDCRIGNHVHLSPGVRLAGGVFVGDFAHVGAGAVVLPGIEIGARAVVGAGAVVVRPVPPGAVVVGVPAKPIGLHTLTITPEEQKSR
jgi:sugar O-acyltransferase (sialic acid O-acetyltransferase NeuD family)